MNAAAKTRAERETPIRSTGMNLESILKAVQMAEEMRLMRETGRAYRVVVQPAKN